MIAAASRRRDVPTAGILILLAAIAWWITIRDARAMACPACTAMSVACPMCMGTGRPAGEALAAFLGMWTPMMAAMMLPSIVPMVLLYARVAEGRSARGFAFVPTWVFAAGYLLAWALLGLAAFGAVRAVHVAIGAVPALLGQRDAAGGLTLLAAGLYQASPWKDACLRHCRGPLDFLLGGWRDGAAGALRMGLSHGLSCVGCCLGLMAVMFAVGLMNLAWMAGLTAVMALEKIAPRGDLLAKAAALLLLAAGGWVLLQAA